MVFNATFNNISVTSWQSVLLVEETEVPGENHRPIASHWLYHIMLYRVYLAWAGFKLTITIRSRRPLKISAITNYFSISKTTRSSWRCCTLRRAKNTPTRSFVSNLYISQHSLPENGSQTNLKHREKF